MMTPKEFYNELEAEFLNGAPDSELNKKVSSTKDLALYAMKAYALHALERVEKQAENEVWGVKDLEGSPVIVVYMDDLKSIFEKRKKELNGESETRQTYPCKVCGKPFGDKLSMYDHYDEEHNRSF